MGQSLGEAQEIVVARAIEKGNAPGLVSALANAAARHFKRAAEALAPLDATLFEKWRVYLGIKKAFYLAYAYAFKACHSDPVYWESKGIVLGAAG